MELINKLMNDIWDTEQKANREYHKDFIRVKQIIIHPKTYHDLMSEKEILNYVRATERGLLFQGIPVIRNPQIDTWKVEV